MPDPDFGQYHRLEVGGEDRAEFVFDRLVGRPTLTVRHAGEGNPGYMRGMLRASGVRRRPRRGLTPQDYRQLREEDVELFSDHVVVAWKDVVDSSGAQVLLTPETCRAFLRAVPRDMLDELRVFASSADNFRAEIDEGN